MLVKLILQGLAKSAHSEQLEPFAGPEKVDGRCVSVGEGSAGEDTEVVDTGRVCEFEVSMCLVDLDEICLQKASCDTAAKHFACFFCEFWVS